MWDWELKEPEEEQEWHSKISHEDQKEFPFPEPAPDPAPQPVVEDSENTEQAPEHTFGDFSPNQPAPAPHQPTFAEVWLPRIRQFLSVPINFYATVGVGVGVLCAVILAAVFWHGNNPNGAYDLGTVSSDAVGLKGRLFTKWDKSLQYRLSFQPTAPDQIQGFSTAVLNSPRPLAIDISLTDPQGFVLCSKQILIRYDARNSTPKDAAADPVTSDPQVSSSIAELADAQQSVREQGKDVFQNQVGADGRVKSISAQGELPCSSSAYENAVAWNFSPDFPSVAQQKELIHQLDEKAVQRAANSPSLLAARRREAARLAANPPPKFYIEGEDAIVDYDAVAGLISTRGGKTFTIDKNGAEAASLKGHDFPLHVHYRCDQFGTCTLFTAGVGTQHTRLRK